MGIGSFFGDALTSASQWAAQGLQGLGDAAANAAATAAQLAQRAAQAAASAARAAANAGASVVDFAGRKAAAGAVLAGDAALAAGALGTGVAAVAGAKGYGAAKAGYRSIKEKFEPFMPLQSPCMPCLAADSAVVRRARIYKRNALIDRARESADPVARQAADQLENDMKAVELARLSENTYSMAYDANDPTRSPVTKAPPEPWKAMTLREAEDAGLNTRALQESKAVVYSLPSDFPFEPKTVVAFRGTTSEAEDIITDHDQALGLKTAQYDAAVVPGEQVGTKLPGAEVTGHSLGGGKAQAAGIAGGLKGQMFNSAGLHPNTMGAPFDGLQRYAGDFIQSRAEGGLAQGGGDPLTGLQNSLAAQSVAFGVAQGLQGFSRANQWALNEFGVTDPLAVLPEASRQLAKDMAERILHITPQQAASNFGFSQGKWYVPPALGEVRGVVSKTAKGENTPLVGQHGMTNLVYGFETRKGETIKTLRAKTGAPGPAESYIGPMIAV